MCDRLNMCDTSSDEECEASRPEKRVRLEASCRSGRRAVETSTATLHARDCVDTMRQFQAETFSLVLADPPYEGVVSQEWDTIDDYMAFSTSWIDQAVRVLKPGGSLLVYGSPERNWIARLSVMLEDDFGSEMRLVQHLAWVYNQGGGSRVSTMRKYAVQHEQLLWFAKKGGRPVFNAGEGAEHYREEERAVALAKGKGRVTDASLDRGRPPRSFLDFQRENSRSRERAYGDHPTMKPLPLSDHLIKLHSCPGDSVFVPFAGSGSELLASARLGRVAHGSEVNADACPKISVRLCDRAGACAGAGDVESAASMSVRAIEAPRGTVSKLPSLHRLPSSASVGVGGEVYGGCKPLKEGLKEDDTTEEDKLGNACYDAWLMKVLDRAMCNEGKNTVIFLAVGGGVLEMKALQRMRDWMPDFHAIKHIVLIDPFTDAKDAEEIKQEFKREFPSKTVDYFVGASTSESAYSKATEHLCSEDTTIRFVAGINFQRIYAPTRIHVALLDHTITFYTLLEQKVDCEAFRTKIIAYQSTEYVVEEREFRDIIEQESNLHDQMSRLVR